MNRLTNPLINPSIYSPIPQSVHPSIHLSIHRSLGPSMRASMTCRLPRCLRPHTAPSILARWLPRFGLFLIAAKICFFFGLPPRFGSPSACVRGCMRGCMRGCVHACLLASLHGCARCSVRGCVRGCMRVHTRIVLPDETKFQHRELLLLQRL